MSNIERKCWRCGLGGDLVEPMSNSPEHRTPSECIRAANQEIGRLTNQLVGAVDLLDKLEAYVGHVNCGVVHGAPECTCGFDDLYAQVRATVRGGQ